MESYNTVGRGYGISQAIAGTGVGGLEGRMSGKQGNRLNGLAEELVGQGITSRDDVFKAGKAKGFTLIELLVVISIIGLAMGILLPALGSAKKSARNILCQTNERSVGQAVHVYATDNNEMLPRGPPLNANASSGLFDASIPNPVNHGIPYSLQYIADPKVLFCPEANYLTINGPSGMQNWGSGSVGSSFFWRNSSANAPAPKIQNYGSNNSLMLDNNLPYDQGKYNVHDNNGDIGFANILYGDGSVRTKKDPNHDSTWKTATETIVQAKDRIFTWAGQ